MNPAEKLPTLSGPGEFEAQTSSRERVETDGDLALEDRAARERRLRSAVLIDAIHCIGGTSGPWRERRLLRHQALSWLRRSSDADPFSFPQVCEALGLSPSRVRRLVLARCLEAPGSRQRAARLQEQSPAPSAARSAPTHLRGCSSQRPGAGPEGASRREKAG